MGFTTPCFIRKNTPELRKKLEELGYRKYGNPFQITDYSKLITTIDGEYVPYNVLLDDSWIDCGVNEDLFLAIAALRNDIDIHQWFTDSKEWFQCRFLKVGMHYSDKPEILFERWHKATVEELMEHFKDKEE